VDKTKLIDKLGLQPVAMLPQHSMLENIFIHTDSLGGATGRLLNRYAWWRRFCIAMLCMWWRWLHCCT